MLLAPELVASRFAVSRANYGDIGHPSLVGYYVGKKMALYEMDTGRYAKARDRARRRMRGFDAR